MPAEHEDVDQQQPKRGRKGRVKRTMGTITLHLPDDLLEWIEAYTARHTLYKQELGRLAFMEIRDSLERAPEDKVQQLIDEMKALRQQEAPSTRRAGPRQRRKKDARVEDQPRDE